MITKREYEDRLKQLISQKNLLEHLLPKCEKHRIEKVKKQIRELESEYDATLDKYLEISEHHGN